MPSVCHSLYLLPTLRNSALTTILNRRSLVISRSTYPGSGAHGGHWLGDNASQWPDLVISIPGNYGNKALHGASQKCHLSALPGILQFSLFGIPLVSTPHQRTVSLFAVMAAIFIYCHGSHFNVLFDNTFSRVCNYLLISFLFPMPGGSRHMWVQ